MKIGIAVTTTPCRQSVYQEWLQHYNKHVPEVPLFINNDIDGSGVAVSKNNCLKALYNGGFEHLFLFDDDLLIQSAEFIERYVESGLNHACWNYDKKAINFSVQASMDIEGEVRLTQYDEYYTPNGCMLYCTRKVLHVAGGFDTEFKGYGYDHPNWSDRIYNNGLTPARYIDIPNSKDLFKMADCESSISYDVRASTIPINRQLYQQKYYSKEFKPFK